jgi:protein required for attachment to host cells
MAKTWILVAHRSGARLFENSGPGKGLELLQNIDNPAGKLKNQEINSDKPGRSFDRRGGGRHAYSAEQDPTTHVAEHFAKQLGALLEDGRTEQRYSRLVLVADPRFLGLLRGSLPAQTAALVSATLDKDLGGIEPRDLPRHLENVVYV